MGHQSGTSLALLAQCTNNDWINAQSFSLLHFFRMNNQRNFVRGSEATSSVRLRRRKDANSSEGTKKRNRHSGDFFVWSAPGSNNNNKNNNGNRLSQDWSYMVPQAPSSLMVASTTSRKNYGLVDDPSPLSMPYSPVVAAAIAAHRQQQRSSSNGRIDEEDGFMETLDRRIPPSVRPIARDNSRFLETSSDFITSKSRLLSGNRRSCDVSQFHVEDYQGRAEPVKKRPLSVVGSGTFLPNNSNINNYNNNKLQNNSNKFGLSSKGKKLAKVRNMPYCKESTKAGVGKFWIIRFSTWCQSKKRPISLFHERISQKCKWRDWKVR